MPLTKPLSLLPKYLLITLAVCAVAVTLTGVSLYAAFRSALDEALAESTGLYAAQTTARIREHAATTTRVLAERLATLKHERRRTEVAATVERGRALAGASLTVLLDADGRPESWAGDLQLLPEIAALSPGETRGNGALVASRHALVHRDGVHGELGQVFDARVSVQEADAMRRVLAAMVSRYGRRAVAWSALISLAVMAGVLSLLVVFARRQIADIRRLSGATELMEAGQYEGNIALARRDELGELSRRLDALRQRLHATTVSRDYLDRILASMNEALLLVAPDGRVRRVNAAASRLLELPETQLVGRPVGELFAPGQREEFVLADAAARAREVALVTASGQRVPVSVTVSVIEDPDPAFRGFIIAARNISERKLAEQRIRYLARIDSLTKIPNRMQFQHLLQRTIARCSRQGRRFALLYLDVDRFKDINDIYGHAAGDLCLETLAERVLRLLPASTVMGRFAGDEFGVILESGENFTWGREALAATARSVLRELAEPLPFHGQQIHMTASIGIAAYPDDARNVIDLVRSADSALYHAKRGGGDTFEFFDPEMNALAAERLMLKSKLRRAYEQNELVLEYQPKIDVRTGRVAGAEALLRWDPVDGERVSPADFIPLAEESNLILEIGEWVLDRVCRDFQGWQAQHVFPGKIAVNLSLKQLRQPDFAERVKGIFARHGVPPASLELEITESTLMDNPERTLRILDELYSMGLSLAIDDFGTGYSSLSALQKFPINTLKIDQSFVREAALDADDATIVATVVQMGHGLELDVVAEGVESARQLAYLRSVGCDFVQGLLFGEPMSAGDLGELLLRQQQGPAPFRRLVG